MQPEIHAIVKALIAYVFVNPHACDNEEGIERWWLADQRPSSRDVSAALDWLVQEEVLETVTARDGRIRFRRLATLESLKAALDEFRRVN